MQTPLRILMLEDSPDDERLVRRELARAGVMVARHHRVETLGALRAALGDGEWDIALLDFNLPEAGALSALAELREHDVDLPAIVVTGTIDEEVAATVFRAGARDIVLKSRLARLGPAVWREAAELAGRRAGRVVSKRLHEVETSLQTARKMEAVGQLAGGIAHDFNNILAVIRAFSDLLGDTFEAGDERKSDVAGMQEAVDRGAALVRQLLAFSRQQVLQPKPVPINALVARLSAMLSRTLTERLVLETRLDPHAGSVFADPTQIEQIVMNLVVNARDAIPGHGRIVLSTRVGAPPANARSSQVEEQTPGEWVLLSVSDDGVGMDETTRARVFEPFFTTKEQGRGTGLGLATVYGIVRQSNGVIRVRSAPGAGSTFDVYLPRTADTADATDATRPPDPHRRGHGERIALVEDDPLVRLALARILRREGFEVLEWATAEDAIRAVSAPGPRPDVYVADVVLPGMTGVELVRALFAANVEVPVILMSGHDFGEVETIAPSAAARFLRKPVTSPELLEAVHRAIDEARAKRLGTSNSAGAKVDS